MKGSWKISSNLELGKFFPDKSGVTIPMFVGFSESRINPQYNPLDPDIPLKSALNNAETKQEKDSIKRIAQDYTKRSSINFTNVRKQKMQGQPRFYDLANWNASYGYSGSEHRDINTEYDIRTRHRGALNYIYNTRPKNVQPFAKANVFTSPHLRLLKDMNFYFYPSRFSFRTDLNRDYAERKIRNLANPGIKIDTIVSKNFIWNRYYDLQFDLTRALKFDFSATNSSRVDEPEGVLRKGQGDYEEKMDSLWREIFTFGRNTRYNHNFNVAYTIPINKIPLLNWVSSSARYSATYGWDVGPITADTIVLGNNVKNSNNIPLIQK